MIDPQTLFPLERALRLGFSFRQNNIFDYKGVGFGLSVEPEEQP